MSDPVIDPVSFFAVKLCGTAILFMGLAALLRGITK